MNVPEDLLYSKEHEWVRIDGSQVQVGITDYAQHSLGDIVFVELPEIDSEIKAMDEAGVVESVKAVSPIYCPLSGKIIAVNEKLENNPELLNSSPYDEWIFTVEITCPEEKSDLLDSAAYQEFCTLQK